jgi:hypothetical protein
MRQRLAHGLLVVLAAIAVTASTADAQDTDAGAVSVRSASPDAPRAPEEPEQPAHALPPRNAAKTEFRLPVVVFSIGAAADWTSTAWSLSHPTSREDNPMIAWAHSPAAIIAAGAAIDAVGAYAWMKATKNHRNLQAVGFLVGAAFRGYLVIHNIRTNGGLGAARR